MTESDWLTSTDPQLMLSFLLDSGASDRKLRLYACALARELTLDRPDDPFGAVVRRVENEVDSGLLDGYRTGLAELRTEIIGTFYDRPLPGAPRFVTVGSVIAPDVVVAIVMSLMVNNEMRAEQHGIVVEAPLRREDFVDYGAVMYRYLPLSPDEHARYRPAAAVPLLRCIFGDPFHPTAFDPGWRTEAVVSLARGVYEERAFERMPVLADALEDAGCANSQVLEHCRGVGPHHRGCWVVDLVLGKT